MSDIEKKRSFVYDLYPGKKWHGRVKRMSDEQVLAIYLKNQSKVTPKPEEKSDDKPEDTIPF